MLKRYVIILFLILYSFVYSQVKRELRGAWIATIKNIDWPSAPGLSAQEQKSELTKLFKSLHQAGINAVFFQIRTECDALYPSEIEPWSYWLTGKQSIPQKPFYDPLKFAIKLARKNGMEFHAWINPFRVKADTAGYQPDLLHVSFQRKDWVLQSGKYKFLNPGIPEVRGYVKQIVLDVVNRYDVDGIHFDDYFYPYSGITNQDSETFQNNNRGFENIADWRRDNVNIFIRDIYENIKKTKPYIKFGISPFGIWKDGEPQGIKGFSAYHKIYSDAVYWLQEKIVDYIVPQIYWKTGGDQDYRTLANWWAQQPCNRQLFIGHALYKMDKLIAGWKTKDITEQIDYNQKNQNINGSIFFRAKDIQQNLNFIADSLKQKYYKNPALVPRVTWIDSIAPPLFPFNLRAIPSAAGTFLMWENPEFENNEDKISYNVVYRFGKEKEIDITNGENVLSIISSNESFYIDTSGVPGVEYKYVVTGLDRLFNEGDISNTAAAKYSQLEIVSDIAHHFHLFEYDTLKNNIKFSIAENDIVKISIFNQNGDKLYNLVNENLTIGLYNVKVNYSALKSGKYYFKITTPKFSEMKSFLK